MSHLKSETAPIAAQVLSQVALRASHSGEGAAKHKEAKRRRSIAMQGHEALHVAIFVMSCCSGLHGYESTSTSFYNNLSTNLCIYLL